MNKLILSIAVVTVCALPAVARPYQQTENNGTAAQQQPIAANQSKTNEELLQGTEFENKKQNTDNPAGMGDAVHPTWQWYWDQKAQIDLQNKHGFWGNDGFGKFAANVTNTYIAPAWNAVMYFDPMRILVLLVVPLLIAFGIYSAVKTTTRKNVEA